MNLLELLCACLVSIATWSAPQPTHSAGLLVIYGGQRLIEANAEWHGYDLGLVPDRCGFAGISPSMLGRLAWFSNSPLGPWQGPCLSVDGVARQHAYESIFVRQEVGEISWDLAETLGFSNGGQWGFVYFSPCPPPEAQPGATLSQVSAWEPPQLYVPPLHFSSLGHESFWPYPQQEQVNDCDQDRSQLWPPEPSAFGSEIQ